MSIGVKGMSRKASAVVTSLAVTATGAVGSSLILPASAYAATSVNTVGSILPSDVLNDSGYWNTTTSQYPVVYAGLSNIDLDNVSLDESSATEYEIIKVSSTEFGIVTKAEYRGTASNKKLPDIKLNIADAVTTYDGTKLPVTVTVKPTVSVTSDPGEAYSYVPVMIANGALSLNALAYERAADAFDKVVVYADYSGNVEVGDAENFYDGIRNGYAVWRFSDLDVYQTKDASNANYYYNEGIALADADVECVYASSRHEWSTSEIDGFGTLYHSGENTTKYYDSVDEQNNLGGIIAVTKASGFDFKWRGSNGCATNILQSSEMPSYIKTYANNGTITASGYVKNGTSKTVTYAPTDDGYELVKVLVDGNDVTKTNPSSYTFSDIASSHTIAVTYKAKTYNITTSVENGVIDGSVGITQHGISKTIHYQAKTGYHLASVVVDGESVDISEHRYDYTFDNINEDHTISVVYEPDTYTITTTALHGSIDATATVEHGQGRTISYAPDAGYKLHKLTVDGKVVDISKYPTSYGFTDVTSDHTIDAEFIASEHTVSTEVVNGVISLGDGEQVSGDVSVADGDSRTLWFQSDHGYALISVVVDGIDVTDEHPKSYTFSDVHEDHTVKVVFAKKDDRSVTTSVTNGTIDPSTFVEYNGEVTVNYAPKAGYHLKSVKVNGVDQDIATNEHSITLKAIVTNQSVEVVYEADEHTITTSANAGGTIDAACKVATDETKTVNYAPKAGYHVKSVTVDGESVDVGAHPTSYTFDSVQSDHTVDVVFEKDGIAVTTSVEGGTITPSFTTDYGTDAVVSYEASEGYHLKSVKVNGKDVTSDKTAKSVTISAIKAATAVDVVFEKDSFSVKATGINGEAWSSGTAEYGGEATVSYKAADGYSLSRITDNGKSVDVKAYPETYTISDVRENHDVKVYFEKTDENLSVTTSAVHGTIDATKTGLHAGATVQVKYTADAGYRLKSVTVDGTEVDIAKYPTSYTFENLDRSHIIDVVYADAVYDIATEVEGGTISGPASVTYGESATVSYAADEGCHLVSLTVDGKAVDVKKHPTSYTFDKVEADHTVKAVFAKGAYDITTSVEGGTITEGKTVEEGESAVVEYTADAGYELASIIVDGKAVDVKEHPTSYAFDDVKASHDVKVVFRRVAYNIETVSVGGGTVSEPVTVKPGESATVTYKANAGHRISSITVDGRAVDIAKNAASYTFDKVDADHSVEVVFSPDSYVITTSVVNGKIDDSVVASYGEAATVAYEGLEGYHLAKLIVDGLDVDVEQNKDSYTFETVTGAHEVKAVYEKDTFAVTTTVTNGTIDADMTVEYGGSATVAYEADEGYHLKSVKIDGSEVDIAKYVSSYTFEDVTEAHTVDVVFEKDADNGGSGTASGGNGGAAADTSATDTSGKSSTATGSSDASQATPKDKATLQTGIESLALPAALAAIVALIAAVVAFVRRRQGEE